MTEREMKQKKFDSKVIQIEEKFMDYRAEMKRISDVFRAMLGANILIFVSYLYLNDRLSFSSGDYFQKLLYLISIISLIPYPIAAYLAYKKRIFGMVLTAAAGLLLGLSAITNGEFFSAIPMLIFAPVLNLMMISKKRQFDSYKDYEGYPFTSAREYAKKLYADLLYVEPPKFTPAAAEPMPAVTASDGVERVNNQPAATQSNGMEPISADELSAAQGKTLNAFHNWDDDVLPPVSLSDDETIEDIPLASPEETKRHMESIISDYNG